MPTTGEAVDTSRCCEVLGADGEDGCHDDQVEGKALALPAALLLFEVASSACLAPWVLSQLIVGMEMMLRMLDWIGSKDALAS